MIAVYEVEHQKTVKTWMQHKMFKFFLVSVNQKKISGSSGATDEQLQ